MTNISDSELIMLCRENNEDAQKLLDEKYNIVIKKFIKDNYEAIRVLNIPFDDLYNECFETYKRAVENYRNYNKASFYTFASTLIKRKIKKVILTEIREQKKKSVVLLSDLENQKQNNEFILADSKDPLEIVCEQEQSHDIYEIILSKLSIAEINIITLLIDGLDCKKISILLKKDYSYIYRKIQTIRKKLILELNLT